MINRFLLLAALVTTSLSAAPLTITFTGTATGTVGTTAFTNQPFTITFNSDTTSVVQVKNLLCERLHHTVGNHGNLFDGDGWLRIVLR